MIKAAFGSLFFVGCLFCLEAYADLPPDPRYVRETVSVTLEPQGDFSDYRFFLDSPMRIEEIKILKNEPTVIEGRGRGGAGRMGTLWAIPQAAIPKDFDFAAPDKVQSIRQAMNQGQYHAVKLLDLDFQATIREEERAALKDPVYRLDKKGETPTATLISGDVRQNQSKGPQLYSTEPKSATFWTAVLIGCLLTASFIAAGAWALRRSRLKAL